jgi:adenylate cyclase
MEFQTISTPRKASLLISFMDIQGFLGIAQALPDSLDLFALLDQLARLTRPLVEAASGRVIKFIGDAALVVFPGDDVDAGVRCLLDLKARLEQHLAGRGFRNTLKVVAHVGEVAIGILGDGDCARLDIIGSAVNTCAMLDRGHHGGRLILSPQAFEALSPALRSRFREHGPSGVYLAEEQER